MATTFQIQIPTCPQGCRAAHNIRTATFLLGVGRTRLYELMNDRVIPYCDTHYGRRIRHDEIEQYLNRTNRWGNNGEHLRNESCNP